MKEPNSNAFTLIINDEYYDQGDAKWIAIRGQLRGHNNTPFRRPTISWPIGRPGVGRPQGVFGRLSYYQLVMLIFNIVPLIMEFTKQTITYNIWSWSYGKGWQWTP
jgi:hypothetical protein